MKILKLLSFFTGMAITTNCYCQINLNSIEFVNEKLSVYDKELWQNEDIDNYLNTNNLWFENSNNNVVVCKKIIICDSCELDSIYLYLNYNVEKSYKIVETSYKKIKSIFSIDNKKLVINYLDERPEYYDATLDDYFWIYNLDSLANGILHKDSIYCKYCSNGHIIDDRLFYTRSNERDDFQGGYWLTDIYVSPLDNIAD
ncbi:MAG: hypothetical protein MJZ01_05435, partial [Bacteroidales bacterium]|nr:hypothetical protein [Bacteroidales bacterium]